MKRNLVDPEQPIFLSHPLVVLILTIGSRNLNSEKSLNFPKKIFSWARLGGVAKINTYRKSLLNLSSEPLLTHRR